MAGNSKLKLFLGCQWHCAGTLGSTLQMITMLKMHVSSASLDAPRGFAPIGLDGYKDLDTRMKMVLHGFPIEELILPDCGKLA
jgi:hypothetical protein